MQLIVFVRNTVLGESDGSNGTEESNESDGSDERREVPTL